MYCILIVEDNPETVKALQRLLNRFLHVPAGALQLDTATTVEAAKALIQGAAKPYHVVLLDFRLPQQHASEQPEVDVSLCLLTRQLMPESLIGHLTSHLPDPVVQEHIRNFHTERAGVNGFSLSKNDNDYPDKLLANLKAFLYGKPIEARLNRLFGTTALAQRDLEPHGLTHEVAELCHEVVWHWADLEEALQTRIGTLLKLEKTVDGKLVKASLF